MPRSMQRVVSQRLESIFHQVNVQDLWYRPKGRTLSAATRPSYMFSSTHGPQGEQRTHAKKTCCVECGTCIDSVPREIFNAIKATRSPSSNRNEELATRMMLERVSRLSDGDHEQAMMVQLFLDCVDRATASCAAFVSFREQPMHFYNNQTLNLRVVDPIADEGVWAIIDDGCNSCCHGEVWRQSAQRMMKSEIF